MDAKDIRPSDPSLISFDRACFKITGTRIEWHVRKSFTYGGTEIFQDEESARTYARGCREVTKVEIPIQTRIRWTLPQ